MSGERPAFNAVQKGNPRSSGYTRNKDEFYVEPAAAVLALIDAEKFYGHTHDPACGTGTIPRTFLTCGLEASGADLTDRGYTEGAHGVDFLLMNTKRHDNIVCNPPYNLANEFALKAIDRARHKVALFVRLAWLEGLARHRTIFGPHLPSRVLVFSNRVSCPPGNTDITPKNGAVAYAWIIWNKDHRGPTQLDWVTAR